MRWFWKIPWMTTEWRLVAKGTNHVIRVQPHIPPLGQREKLQVELVTQGQWFTQSCLFNEDYIRNLNWRSLKSFWVGEHVHVLRGWCAQRKDERMEATFFDTLPYTSLLSCCSGVISSFFLSFLLTSSLVSKLFFMSSGSCSSKVLNVEYRWRT